MIAIFARDLSFVLAPKMACRSPEPSWVPRESTPLAATTNLQLNRSPS
jgi:hypothetical protein